MGLANRSPQRYLRRGLRADRSSLRPRGSRRLCRWPRRLPAVPRASDDIGFELALAKRAAAVQAGIVNRVEFAVHVGDGNRRAVHLELADGPGGDFVRLRGTLKSHYATPV